MNIFIRYVIISYLVWSIVIVIGLGSCEDSERPTPEEEVQEISTLRYTLIDPGANQTKVFYYQDLDGSSGANPTITTDTLDANALYFGSLELLNENANPTENISEAIEKSKTDYQFFFIINDANAALQYADGDANNNPVGLFTALKTNSSSSGTFVINLQYKPNKLATGVSDGNLLNAGGRTNIQVTFPIVIK